MRIPYTTDAAYRNFYKCAAKGDYDSHFCGDRARVTTVAGATAVVGAVRSLGRVVNTINELVKIVFYSLASICSLASHEHTKRLKDHCKLFALNAAALLAQPLQFAIHTIAIVIGIIHPKTAYHLMHAASWPITMITTHEQQIWQQYNTPKLYTELLHGLKNTITHMLSDMSWDVQMAMKTVVHEFPEALNSGLTAPLGFIEPFRLFNANPTVLTEEQKQLTPILLLNGNYSHQATFLPLLHALEQSQNKRPVYTIHVPPNSLCDTDDIKDKVELIKKQYNKTEDESFAIDMLGHSMGSGIIQILASQQTAFKINKIVTVGTPIFSYAYRDAFNEAFDITGKSDLLVDRTSLLDKEHAKEIDTGHLGLLYHPDSLQAMQDFLNLVH